MLTSFVQGLTLDLLFVCTKFYCCDCCEVFNVHLTFSANLEAESVSKQVKTSHADFLMACVMIVHADRTHDHINYGVTKRDAWQTALEGQRRLISIALFFICKKLCARIETIKEIRKKISSSCYFNEMKRQVSQALLQPFFTHRLFPVFHAYMAGIVQVLDQNQEWGNELLNLTLQLLLFCAAPKPHKRTQTPEFSLICIPPFMRQTWLMALLVILYKVMRISFIFALKNLPVLLWIRKLRKDHQSKRS